MALPILINDLKRLAGQVGHPYTLPIFVHNCVHERAVIGVRVGDLPGLRAKFIRLNDGITSTVIRLNNQQTAYP